MYLKQDIFLFFEKCLRKSPLRAIVFAVYYGYCYSCYKVVAICNWWENNIYYTMESK